MKIMHTLFMLGLALATYNAVAGEVSLDDDFTQAKEGAALNGEKVGKSKHDWKVTPNVIMAAKGGLELSNDRPFLGRVELGGKAKKISVEAEVYPSPSAEAYRCWVGVGIGNDQFSPPNFRGVMLILRPGGVFSLIFNPASEDGKPVDPVVLKNGRLSTWIPTGMNQIKLVFDKEKNTVSAFANEKDVLVNELSLKDKGLVLESQYAGFSGYGQTPDVKTVGSFSLSVSE